MKNPRLTRPEDIYNGIQIAAPSQRTVSLLPDLPDPLGFAGMYGGVSGGALICAGGANFSGLPLAQGGQRVWHDRIYALERPDGEWREIGRLPRPLGYGVSGSWNDAMVIAGGMDAKQYYREAWLLRYQGAKLVTESLPDLPVTTANCCGTIVGRDLYVLGGQAAPEATSALARGFVCNLAAHRREWRELSWPEGAPGRILAVAGADGEAFFMFSGAALEADQAGKIVRTYLTDAWRFHPASGWQRLLDLPRPAAAAPSPAWQRSTGEWAIFGGIWAEYLAAAEKAVPYPGFSREVLVYSEIAQKWRVEAPPPALPHVHARIVAPPIPWRGGLAVVSGEIAPGLRARNSEFLT